MDREARDLSNAGAALVPRYPPRVTNRAARDARSPLRVVLFNAAGGVRFDEIVACLKRPPLSDADLVLLCEVDLGMRRSGRRDVAGDLASILQMSCAYVPEFGVSWDGGEVGSYMGNAVLSAVPFDQVEAVALPNPGMSRRPRSIPQRLSIIGTPTGLVTSVKIGGVPITVGVAHLHSRCTPRLRERQMAAYLDSFPLTGRAIFGGDLNSTTMELNSTASIFTVAAMSLLSPRRFKAPQSREPLFERIRERGLEIAGLNVANRSTFTFSALIPPLMRPKLDWLAARDLKPVPGSAKVIAPRTSIFSRRASDHDFVFADLEL